MKAIRNVHNAERLNEIASIVITYKLQRNSSIKKLFSHWTEHRKHLNPDLNPFFFRDTYIFSLSDLSLMVKCFPQVGSV